jgi:GR25 family glycosyltransferase involved in LPS biosynthesis
MENIDVIYYINLEHRKDRKAEFLQEMKRFGVPEEKIQRIDAVHTPGFGIYGCGLSHKKALETFLESGYKRCIVFEDDYVINIDINYLQYIMKSIFADDVPFDLIMLAGNVFRSETTQWHYLNKVSDAQTTSAYMICREFAPKLVENLTEGTHLLKDWFDTHNHEKKHDFCLDIFWKTLQPNNRWFITNPKTGIQRESYSDIENKVTKYGV